MTKLEKLKDQGKAPEWMTEEAYATISRGYLLPGEEPVDAYKRVSRFASKNYINSDKFESDFFDAIWNNWLCPASPVLSNSETKNLTISCYSGTSEDSLNGIMNHLTELAMLTKYGGGVGSSFDRLRGTGEPVSSGGYSSGIIPFLKMLDTVVDGVKQGTSRRGAVASYLNIEHKDAREFIQVRSQTGDLSRKVQSVAFHNAVTISDEIMYKIMDGDAHYRDLWNLTMNGRVETGEPYMMFLGNANKNCPDEYVGKITQSNLCSEIAAPVTPEETFVCCLSSLNLARYREWENFTFPKTGLTLNELGIYFLDSNITNFVNQAKNLPGLEKAVRFAERHRMLGLGVLGWHTLLQSEEIPFEGFQAMTLNNKIFSRMRKEVYKASYDLAKLLGPCEVNGQRRNTALLAVAPTMSNSLLSGGVSQGIEPIVANVFAQKTAKGIFVRKNPVLESALKTVGLDTIEVWDQINKDRGSVRNIDGLPEDFKKVYLTAREINQYAIIQQAAQRQAYIDQMQSINLFFSLPQNPEDSINVSKYINGVHLEAWKLGVKSLYYMKTESPIKGDVIFVDKESGDCKACEG